MSDSKTTKGLWKQILSVAGTIAAEENLQDEDSIIDRVQELQKDAMLDVPLTDAGKEVRRRAEENLVKEGERKEIQFNYGLRRNETAIVALNETMKAFGKYENLFEKYAPTEEDREASSKDYEALSLEVFAILNKNNVGIGEYEFFFKMAERMLQSLADLVNAQVHGHKNEIVSRVLGARNPGTDKFDASYSTYGNLIDILKDVREGTGGDVNDYLSVESE